MRHFLQQLNEEFARLQFSSAWVYNPWEYAGEAYLEYWQRYGNGPRKVVLLGMNPGPWGMAQTGVPFGEVSMVRDWLAIGAAIGAPERQHPKRPVLGWGCARSEVSGRRLWGYLKQRYGRPEAFFEWGFVGNYCPLVFMDESARNLTPDKLPVAERRQLLSLCDRALEAHLKVLQPRYLIGVGKWAEQRAAELVARLGLAVEVGSVPHPSPANPAANRGWGEELGHWLDRVSSS